MRKTWVNRTTQELFKHSAGFVPRYLHNDFQRKRDIQPYFVEQATICFVVFTLFMPTRFTYPM